MLVSTHPLLRQQSPTATSNPETDPNAAICFAISAHMTADTFIFIETVASPSISNAIDGDNA
jgi:hypothetical protein